MASIILTAAGTALGGPIGGLIGNLAGQTIDGAIFARPMRQGPRLADLAVQTSSYGGPIPLLFGTLRVAGSVIWSTDLIETRSTSSAGKGQPRTTNYAYAASFAVLLSGRPILEVRRIWADGNLLRGAAGDWKIATGFRLHTGDPDQQPDPLISSAEGARSPAYRGHAYAVFENLPLAHFGNRIPSLTFEVVADPAPPRIDAIASAIGGGLVRGGAVAMTLTGFAAYGEQARAVLALLGQAAGGWWRADYGGVVLAGPDGAAIKLADQGTGAGKPGMRADRRSAALSGVPVRLSVAHYDPARDYQSGVQQACRPGPGARIERLDLPAVIEAGAAKALAATALARAEAERVRRTLTLDSSALAVVAGALVEIAGEDGLWRVASVMVERLITRVALVPVTTGAVSSPASSGRVLPSPDAVVDPTIVHVVELPPIDGAVLASPRVMIAAAGAGAGWRRASLLYSIDDGLTWSSAGDATLPALVGTLAAPLAAGSTALVDHVNQVEVQLLDPDAVLLSATDAALDGGANLALVGDELLQFGRAQAMGGGRWRLSRLWRGRRGTEAAVGRAAASARFVLAERAALVPLDLPTSAIGGMVRVLATGAGDPAPVEAQTPLTGASVVPPSPVHCRIDADGTLRWTRRSRLGFAWPDSADAALVEENEAYRVITARRVVVTDAPSVALDPDERTPGAVLTIVQLGTVGASAPATLTL